MNKKALLSWEGRAFFHFHIHTKKMNKPDIRTLRINLAAGETFATGSINIPSGAQIFAGAAISPAPDKLVRISIDQNGNTIHDPLSSKWWDGSLGTFQQRARQLNYNGGSTLDVKVQVSTALSIAIEIEIAFEIWKAPAATYNNDGTLIPGTQC